MNILDRVVSSSLKSSDLFIPQWECTVRVREFTAGERADFAKFYESGPRTCSAKAVIWCVSDPETGKDVFETAHVDLLTKKSAAAVELILNEILQLSGIKKAAAEDLEKNS